MYVKVMDVSPNARDNFNQFQRLLGQRVAQSSDEQHFKVLLNRKTGGMRFPENINELGKHLSQNRWEGSSLSDWKEIQIIVSHSKKNPHFDLKDSQNKPLEPTDLDPIAWKIATETLAILNEDSLKNLPGWVGTLGRIEAEKKLEGKPIGTYLVREGDSLTEASVFHLAKENHLVVYPFILTVVEMQEKISDILLLKTEKGWILYQDEPNLGSYSHFRSASELLLTIDVAKYPLV
jgi:hypothetical protein